MTGDAATTSADVPGRLAKVQPLDGIRMLFDVPVPMHDGTRLSTDIYLPDGDGPFPAVLARTPYDNSAHWYAEDSRFFPRHGYAFVVQDCRGRFDSEGVFYAWHNEAKDGYDTQEWLGRQPWCTGRIGTIGASYDGATQWQSAPLRSTYLKAMVPMHTPSDFWLEDEYVGGAFSLALNVHWCLGTSSRTAQRAEVYDWNRIFWALPVIEIDQQAGRDIEFYRDWVLHASYDDYWRQISNHDKYGEMDVAVLNVGGWYDAYAGAAFRNYDGLVRYGRTPEARRSQMIVVGPWAHDYTETTRTGQVDFGPGAALQLRDLELRWFDYWLKEIDNGIMDEPPVRIFVMGENVWRDEHEWPLARTELTAWYLHSGGHAGRLSGDGMLAPDLPGEEPPDEYDYDPAHPVPTLGGNHSMLPEIVSVGPWDQRPIEGREDVLVYASQPLERDMEVTGPVSAVLYASSSARDTDFTVRLIDVHPDGLALNVCEGVLRARYRDSIESPSPLEPGHVYELRIDMDVVSNLFRCGHRIRVDVSSSNFPRIDRNPNTGNEYGLDAALVVAHQSVHHNATNPSHILLPVIPRE